MKNVIINGDELFNYGGKESSNLPELLDALKRHQIDNWTLFSNNYKNLSAVKSKVLSENPPCILQYNPARLTSTAALVDKDSIARRRCFLCPDNLPDQQRGLLFKSNYLILCNPYPVFENHYTVAHINHLEQRIVSNIDDMISLAETLSERFVVLYNGPACGASAPDHLHFQVVDKNSLPLFSTVLDSAPSSNHKVWKSAKISMINNSEIRFVLFSSFDKDHLIESWEKFYTSYQVTALTGQEPLMNLAVYKNGSEIKLVVFPRRKHRPDQYFFEGEDKILISPASIDLCGVFILPREEDFLKIDNADIGDICRQVLLPEKLIEGFLLL